MVPDPATLAAEVLAVLGTPRQIEPFSRRIPGFDLAVGHRVGLALDGLRRARGERPAGRKIAFSNPALWPVYGIAAPIPSTLFAATVRDLPPRFDPSGLAEPLIEPELVLHLARAPAPGMDEGGLAACLDWVAPAYEIVASPFPGWRFEAADCAAAGGLHAALLIGPRLTLSGPEAAARLLAFSVRHESDHGTLREGDATAVLGGPLKALAFLVRALAAIPGAAPLAAGEVVTTGTLTDALPARPGEGWTTRFDGLGLPPLHLRFAGG